MAIVRLSACDYEDATDFLDLVFSTAHCPMEFRQMLPILYQPTEEKMRCNFAVREKGKIRAIVGLFPARMQVGDTVLRLGGIGGVSSHPNDRGRGWMKALMQRAHEEMAADGTDLSWLGGLRQRYQYYGYEKTGTLLSYEVTETNLRHAFRDCTPAFRFVRITAEDQAYLDMAKTLHDAQPVYCHRAAEEFYLYLLSGHTKPWAALTQEGEFAGYLCVTDDGRRITEFFPAANADPAEWMFSWFSEQHASRVEVLLAPWQKHCARALGKIAENYGPEDNDNWRIYRWDRVVDSFLRLKHREQPLPEGVLILDIEDYGTLRIAVEAGSAHCEKTDAVPQISWDSFTAMRVLFGHTPADQVTELPAAVRGLVNAWFPLPLSWLMQNHV